MGKKKSSRISEREYDSEALYYLDVKVWEQIQPFYKLKGLNIPKPVWKPSKKWKDTERYELE